MEKIRNVLFKAFAVNYIMILTAWGLAFTKWYANFVIWFFDCDPDEAAIMFYSFLGEWKVLNVILFLAPAIALHWQIKSDLRKTRLSSRGQKAKK
jgi:hypothetical protein